jgi:hypothetical protein
MKATAIALLLVSAYWLEQGVVAIQQQDTTQGVLLLVLGILLLPVSKYLWSKKFGDTSAAK